MDDVSMKEFKKRIEENKRREREKEKEKENNEKAILRNTIIELPVNIKGKVTELISYNVDTMIEKIKKLQNNDVFSDISFPIYMYREDTDRNSKNKKGTVPIGFVRKFIFAETGEITMVATVYARSVPKYNNLKDPECFVRAYIDKDGSVKNILSFEIVNKDRYKDL